MGSRDQADVTPGEAPTRAYSDDAPGETKGAS
jgi:hypothetical protein